MTPSTSKPNKNKKVGAASRASGAGSGSGSLVWIVGVAVVVVLGIVAVILARGSSEDKPPIEEETATVTMTAPAEGGVEGAQVGVEGGLPLTPDEGTDPAIGMTIPTVEGTTFDGAPITIGADGTPKVIVFMAHWCPHCREEIPRLVEHFEESGLPDDVDIVGVSTRVAVDQANYPPSWWLDDEDWNLPTMADSQESLAWVSFGAGGFPYFVVVDADGKVVVRTSGELSMETFDQLVEAARTGEMETR